VARETRLSQTPRAVMGTMFQVRGHLTGLAMLGLASTSLTACLSGLEFDECSSDQQCGDGEVCRAGACEPEAAESTGTTEVPDPDPGCVEGTTQPCVCADESTGTQTCQSGAFAACECGSEPESTGSSSGDATTSVAECIEDADCMTDPECGEATCLDGTCSFVHFPEGTPCGDASDSTCDAADTCDGRGTCQANFASNGSACSECPLGEGFCSCNEGGCDGCSAFASVNGFSAEAALDGWTLTGSWALRYQTPETATKLPVAFEGFVVGSDGNRVEPYPGAEQDTATLRSPVTVLPEFLEFRSWHVDEAGNPEGANVPADNHVVQVSTDGGETWTVIVDCAENPRGMSFCEENLSPRDADDWDDVFLPMPKELVGVPGIVEFVYDTYDECCGEEQGWFIDDVNFGTRCGCTEDIECADFDSACGQADCAPNGDCRVIPMNSGSACGDETESDCIAADSCNEFGVCVSNDPPNWQQTCSACPAGSGGCGYCIAGACPDCEFTVPLSTFEELNALVGWTLTGDWGRYVAAPADTSGSPAISFSTGAVLGTDGNLVAPYGNTAHQETSSATSPVFEFGASLTFQSWHVDEGGFVEGGGTAYDNKTIEVSVDDGETWTTLVNCSETGDYPFCLEVTERTGDAWDTIALDTTAFEGQAGQVRFGYDTVDASTGDERGWYIDEMTLPWCGDAP
jgi:hypothetical protein